MNWEALTSCDCAGGWREGSLCYTGITRIKWPFNWGPTQFQGVWRSSNFNWRFLNVFKNDWWKTNRELEQCWTDGKSIFTGVLQLYHVVSGSVGAFYSEIIALMMSQWFYLGLGLQCCGLPVLQSRDRMCECAVNQTRRIKQQISSCIMGSVGCRVSAAWLEFSESLYVFCLNFKKIYDLKSRTYNDI